MLAALLNLRPAIAPSARDLGEAARLASEHDLTFHDGAYAAVARRRGAQLLAAVAKTLLRAELCRRPSELVERLQKR